MLCYHFYLPTFTQVEVHNSGCCQSSIMHIHAAKLLAQQKSVIAKLGDEDHIASYYLEYAHHVLGTMTAKNHVSHTP